MDSGALSFRVLDENDTFQVNFAGEWTVRHVQSVDLALKQIEVRRVAGREAVLSLSDVSRLDTAGAWMIQRTASQLEAQGIKIRLDGQNAVQQALLNAVVHTSNAIEMHPDTGPWYIAVLERMGATVRHVGNNIIEQLAFFGLVLATLGRAIRHPSRLRLVPLVHHMEKAGLDALPIVALMTFLIGAVIAQQGGVQLQKLGADVYTVNLLAIVFLREVGLLLTAIIVAGRSGSAFTAEIGSMKMREEVDAMRTLGLDPIEMLVLPRVLALVITLPLLTFVGDIMGLIGGGVAVWAMLDTTPDAYLVQLRGASGFWTFGVGLLKAPFMALVIAMIGCRAGLNVTGSAESVGRQTTSSVVQSIFMVIVLDAAFAIFFTGVGI